MSTFKALSRLGLVLLAALVVGCADSSSADATPPTVDLVALSFVNANIGYVAARECEPGTTANTSVCRTRVYRSGDGGQTWARTARFLLDPTALSFSNSTTGWMIGSVGENCGPDICPNVVMRSTDAGAHWDRLSTAPIRFLDIDSVAPTDAWALAQACPVNATCAPQVSTTDVSAQSWSKANLPVKGQDFHLDRLSAMAGWVGGIVAGQAALIGTRDGGVTWHTATSPCQGQSTRLSFRTPDEGWLACVGPPGGRQTDAEIYHTTNGGTSWNDLGRFKTTTGAGPAAGGLPVVTELRFSTAEDGWLTLGSGDLLATRDGGHTWTVSLRADEPLLAIQFADPSHGWVMGIHTVWRTTDGGTHWSSELVDPAGNGS